MACNFLPIRVVDVNKNCDTLSEASECGTVTSEWTSNWDSKEELRDFLSKLGLKDVSDLHQDRFRVDRQKLEYMLTGDSKALIPADVFFARIMEDTDTYITWPDKLKIGAKSKKDPHVRIAGRPEDVKAAKERIMKLLETRCNRITMKMDVGYTDHSHIIGKGGLSIKRVMEETQCHVHFPDSNRSNLLEKSNQVSISGDIYGVERARSRVRELIPLIFGFELPIMTQNVDATSSYIVKIQEQYKVQVMYKTRPKLHATLVLIKGFEWEVDQVKQATLLLMEYMCESLANQIPVQMSMEISPHHHPVVLGKNHSNLKLIMQYTNCRIMFPDAQDPNIPNLKKSNVNISGNIHDVYKARQLLLGSLPLIIIFDLPEECQDMRTRQDQVTEIQDNCEVSITIRLKAKQSTRSCVIKGVEKNAENIYRARNLILGLDEPCVHAEIPPSYRFPSSLPSSQLSPSILPTSTNTGIHPLSPMLNPMMTSPVWHKPSSPASQGPPFVGMVQQPQFVFNLSPQQSMESSGYQTQTHGQFTSSSLSVETNCEASTYSTISSNSSTSSNLSSPRGPTSPYHRQLKDHQDQKNELSSVLSAMNFSPGYHGPSVDKRQDTNNLTPVDFQSKIIAGFKAMQNNSVSGAFRQPNNSWAGYYVSHTSPTPFADIVRQRKENDKWDSSPNRNETYNPISASSSLNASNITDLAPSNFLNNLVSSDWPDLPSLLTSLGLDRFINIFSSQEIDLQIFSTLTDKDLIEIGINTFGVRKRILLAISELNRRSNSFSVAPGAERKNSGLKSTSSNCSSSSERW